MTDAEKRAALDTIIRDSERLRDLAGNADEGFLAFLLENVLHEARATLIGAGYEPPSHVPPSENNPTALLKTSFRTS